MPSASRTFDIKHLTLNKRVSCQLSVVNCRVKPKGFTLIELLIVITIIGILASLTLASFGGAQAKARDGVRKSDLSQMKRALELAKSDCQGAAYYPFLGGANVVANYTALGTYLSNTYLKYISSAPTDPKNVEPWQYAYGNSSNAVSVCPAADGTGDLTIAGGDNYALWVTLERTSDADGTASRTKCNGKPVPFAGSWTDATYAGYYVVCNN